MAAMEEALSTYIITKAEVSAIIGSGVNARLFPIVVPETVNLANGPAATYEIVSSSETDLLTGRDGIVQSRVQIASFATTHSAVMLLARAIKNTGIATLKGIYAGVDFRGVMIEDGIQCFAEQPTDGSDTWRYIAEFDLRVSYLEG